ncbi:MAG: response regulator transcription factor [Firmicutes bacterium]|nr:response regulator transcription factor [Bacillota bacterium]
MDEKRILVMDDDGAQLDAIQNILQQNFPSVVVDICASPQEATELIKKNRYALFLLDIEIEGSGVTGIHLAEKIRQAVPYLNTPIIFVSNHRHLRGRVLQRVCSYDFLVKPYDPQELISSVGEALGIKEYLHQKFEQSQTLQMKVGNVTCRYNVNEIACIQMLKGVLTIMRISGRIEEIRAERGTFDDILEQLEEKKIDRLRRIHRAILVNIDQIKKTEEVGRELELWLFNCSQPLPVSRGFRDNIKEVL